VFVDRVLIEGLTSWVGPLFGVMAGVAVMIGALTLLQQHFLLRMETKLATSTSAQFLWHVLKLPIDFFNQRRAADISVRVTINDRIAQLLSGEVATNLIRLLLVAFYVVVMLQYDVLLTVLGAVMALVNIVALRTVSRKRVDASQRLLTEQVKFTATALNGLQTVETLKATGTDWTKLLAETRDAKGTNNTRALVVTASLADGDRKKEARDALAERLCRMTAVTLRAMLKDKEAELRRAAALACAMKDDKDHIPDLIDALADPDDNVSRAAKAGLKSLTGKDLGPPTGATPQQKAAAVVVWKEWYAKDKK
jgi:ABC-type multidrug transport system fused ATPase/permease subunit